MKLKLMKIGFGVVLAAVLLVQACKPEEFEDPNAPLVDDVIKNPSQAQMEQLTTGLFSQMRRGHDDYVKITGVIGREIYNLNRTESRWYTHLTGNANLSSSVFYHNYYIYISQTRKAAMLVVKGANNSTALSAEGKQGVIGIAATIEAWSMLQTLNMYYNNGIRLDISDPFKPGPYATLAASLAAIRAKLDAAATNLDNAGAGFAVTLPAGFNGFNTPANFKLFNRALAARVAVYQQDWAGARTALNNSFYSTNSPFELGPVFTYSPISPDTPNPLYLPPRAVLAEQIVAQRDFVPQAEAGDLRLQKVGPTVQTQTLGGYSSDWEPRLYATNSSPVSVIRNEELLLISAEVYIQQNQLGMAETLLDRIRAEYGLPRLAIAKPNVVGNQALLIDEMLHQRRYSLWYEGHRWVDMRRYGRLNQLPLDRANDRVWEQLIKPIDETQN